MIEEELMSIVRVGPCQVFADVERNEGVIVYKATAQSQFVLQTMAWSQIGRGRRVREQKKEGSWRGLFEGVCVLTRIEEFGFDLGWWC